MSAMKGAEGAMTLPSAKPDDAERDGDIAWLEGQKFQDRFRSGIGSQEYMDAFNARIDRLIALLRGTGGGEDGATIIEMGHGFVDVGPTELGDRRGIILRPRDRHIPVGEPGELQNVQYDPVAGDVVIWIDDPAGAKVIIDELIPFATPPEAVDGGQTESTNPIPTLKGEEGHG